MYLVKAVVDGRAIAAKIMLAKAKQEFGRFERYARRGASAAR